VRQHELEAEHERAGERGELESVEPSRAEGEQHGAGHQQGQVFVVVTDRDRIARLGEGDSNGAIATVVRISGSAYRRPGAKLFVEPDGSAQGASWSHGGRLLEPSWRSRVFTEATTRLGSTAQWIGIATPDSTAGM